MLRCGRRLGWATFKVPEQTNREAEPVRWLASIAAGVTALSAVAILIALASGETAGAPSRSESLNCPPQHDGFRAIQITTGNSLEGYHSANSCFAESDFRLTRDGALIAAHEAALTGNCGLVALRTLAEMRSCTLGSGRHVASLRDFLSLPLTEWYIDLKNTDTRNEEQILATVKAAVADVREAGREDGAVLLLYNATPSAVRLLESSGVRAGMKWTPRNGESKALVKRLIIDAAGYGFGTASADITLVDRQAIALGASLGVSVLASDANHMPSLWVPLLDAGISGLIVRETELAEQMASHSRAMVSASSRAELQLGPYGHGERSRRPGLTPGLPFAVRVSSAPTRLTRGLAA